MNNKHSALQKKYAPMTTGQIKTVVLEYAGRFPGWTIFVDGTALVRRAGPIQQMVWFQKMRSAAYRPTHGISSIVLPGAYIRMLPQILDVKHREIDYGQHQAKIVGTIVAMETQFRPDIRKTLDISEVLSLCKDEAFGMPDTANNMTMLAILSGWLGYDDEAISYCERVVHCELPKLAPMPEWEKMMRIFSNDLAEAARVGHAQDFLRVAVEAESRPL